MMDQTLRLGNPLSVPQVWSVLQSSKSLARSNNTKVPDEEREVTLLDVFNIS
jgi:hypothetical protein